MKTKVCNRCNNRKPIERFNKKSSRGVQPYCRPCQSEYQKIYYKKDTNRQLQKMYSNRKKRKKDIHRFLTEYFTKHTCVGCAKKEAKLKKLLKGKVSSPIINEIVKLYGSDIRHLTFDHLHTRGEKEHTIAQMITDIQPINKIQKEIKKCVVRCHNCHNSMTIKRSKNWRYYAHKKLLK